MVISIKN